ncbi:glycoside hydrolase family 16 protein [Lutimonas zeaxanthinifaciens]|uniref:glycoside hydrolase family 16 protein n=1 Tax=Lutimonas zeaxanthinifaciens TaxID=3060215 RepID=UPI00265D1C72|nr:glycoside hydrolase family 16 protein [Lutimonas sp. YSD2104]WKK67160.1 glycoside hydrolase family 16 protein [Lutimonas sp. YSD2104]
MKSFLSYTAFSLMFVLTFGSCVKKEKDNSSEIQEKEWKLVWSDEFDGVRIDTSNWNYQVVEAGRYNDEWQRYTDSDENAFIDNGNLVIKAIHNSEDHGMDQYTSARLNTANKQAWKYGKIAARIKLPEGNGIWPAFWMLGANINENGGDTPWPQSGEIDILEFYGSKDDAVVEANIHYADESDSHKMMGAVAYELKNGRFPDDFHVFELEWDAKEISWYVDGEKYATVDITTSELTEFHKEFFILLNLAVGGRHAGRPDESNVFPQQMYVDWVRVYQK